MRTTGRRTLAGIAAGAMAFAGLAFVATPSAQAAQTTAVYCVQGGSPGNGGSELCAPGVCWLPGDFRCLIILELLSAVGPVVDQR